MSKHFSTLVLLASAGLAQAHDGHGLGSGAHWHATDLALLLAAIGAAGLWLVRRK